MTTQVLDRLAALIQSDRDDLLSRWRTQVRQLPSAKHLDTPALNDHIPSLLDELAAAIRAHSLSNPILLSDASPPAHGLQRLKDGFDIEEVVAEYNILRACLHDLADRHGISLQGQPFHIINRILDTAIGEAVQAFATQQALEVQRRREEYLAFVAHDLRTPLNAISLAAKVLELSASQGISSAETSQMLYTLTRNVQHLEGLVRKILEENTNLQTEVGVKLQRRAMDLWPLVESLIHDLHPVSGTNSTRLLNQVPYDMVVDADASLLRRVFQNLIANAIHHTPRGEVTIGSRASDADGAVECWVSDNGEGIPADLLAGVFEKGESNHKADGAAGLGLAIVKTFVEAHGGTVTVDSTVGAGSTFRFTLPKPETRGGTPPGVV